MRIIIIDGYHKGHVIEMPNPHPTIKLPVPKTVTTCDCGPREDVFERDASVKEYKVAFCSIDQKVALYSEDGNGSDFFDGGFASHYSRQPWTPATVLKFGCHEPGAFQR